MRHCTAHRAVVTNTGMESQWDSMTEEMETSLFAFYQCHTLIWMAYLPLPYRYILSQINGIFSLKRCSPANRRGGLIIPRLLSIRFKSWWLWFRLWKSRALAQIKPPESVRFVLIDNYSANYEDIGKIRSSTILPAYTEQLLKGQNTLLFQLACPGRWQDQVPHRSFGKCHFLSSLLSMVWFWRDKNQALATGLYCPLLFSQGNLGADLSFLLLVWSNWERPKNPNCSDVWAPRMKPLLSFQKPSKRVQLLDFFLTFLISFCPLLFLFFLLSKFWRLNTGLHVCSESLMPQSYIPSLCIIETLSAISASTWLLNSKYATPDLVLDFIHHRGSALIEVWWVFSPAVSTLVNSPIVQ